MKIALTSRILKRELKHQRRHKRLRQQYIINNLLFMAMFSKLKQFKDLRDKAKKAQSVFKDINVEGTGSSNRVKIKMNANMQVNDVSIDSELLTEGNKTKLESGIKDALNNAVKKAQREMISSAKKNNLDLPGLS